MKLWRRIVPGIAVAGLIAILLLRIFVHGAPPPAPARFFEGARNPLNIAHRGASGERAEHSWDAYDVALQQGADVLELDVRMTRDGVLVVAHDGDLGRVSGVDAQIAAATLAELRTAAGPKAPLPLADVLAHYPGRLNVEIKEDRPEVADALLGLLRSTARQESVIVASFKGGVLDHFREQAGNEVATAAYPAEVIRFLAAYVTGVGFTPRYAVLQIPRRLGPYIDLGTPGLLAFAHEHGLAVHYWTVDDPADMTTLLLAGADGIMTNFPARLEEVIKHR